MKDKKNPDYTASAVSITNPKEIEILLGQRGAISEVVIDLRTVLESMPAYLDIKKGEAAIANIDEKLVALIDEKGGYQNTDAGHYALRQVRVTLSYKPGVLRECIPDFAGAVINEVVDSKKVGQLIKSKLITETQVGPATIRKETTRVIIET